jgi:predicted dehydrogenase
MTLKILFFGLGSIGKKHASIIKENYDYELFAYRTRKGQEKNTLGIEEFDNINDAFDVKPNIAFITNPTNLHISTALDCAKKNINLFIEKPISYDLEGVERLNSEIKKRKLFSYIAYNLRFHPVLEKIKQVTEKESNPIYFDVICSSYLPNWRKNQDYSKSYSANSKTGGGVILDLSHEFDYLTWLLGKIDDISGFCGKISNLKINCEDIVDVQIKLKSGINGRMHLNYFSVYPERMIKLYYADRFIEGDLINNCLKIINKNGKNEELKFKFDLNETYEKQINYFFDNYSKNNLNIMNNYSEALKTFNKIISFKNNYCHI